MRFEPPPFMVEQSTEAAAEAKSFGLGFSRGRLEPSLAALLRRRFEQNRDRLHEEVAKVQDVLKNVDASKPASVFHHDGTFNHALHLALKPMHEQWCGFPLVPTSCYGIRVYNPGTYLLPHVDRTKTHLISSTICVDAKLDAPWPLTIEDYEGREHEVHLQPGELLFYEGAKLIHGRPFPLEGDFYAGVFVHYQPEGDQEDGGSA